MLVQPVQQLLWHAESGVTCTRSAGFSRCLGLFPLCRPPHVSITPPLAAVGNTMKRVAVVVSSVLFFKNPVSCEWGRGPRPGSQASSQRGSDGASCGGGGDWSIGGQVDGMRREPTLCHPTMLQRPICLPVRVAHTCLVLPPPSCHKNPCRSMPHALLPSSTPHPPAVMNWVGSMVAMLGTGLYSLAKQKASDDAKKQKAAAAGSGGGAAA